MYSKKIVMFILFSVINIVEIKGICGCNSRRATSPETRHMSLDKEIRTFLQINKDLAALQQHASRTYLFMMDKNFLEFHANLIKKFPDDRQVQEFLNATLIATFKSLPPESKFFELRNIVGKPLKLQNYLSSGVLSKVLLHMMVDYIEQWYDKTGEIFLCTMLECRPILWEAVVQFLKDCVNKKYNYRKCLPFLTSLTFANLMKEQSFIRFILNCIKRSDKNFNIADEMINFLNNIPDISEYDRAQLIDMFAAILEASDASRTSDAINYDPDSCCKVSL